MDLDRPGGHSLSLYVPRLSDVPEGVSDDIGSFYRRQWSLGFGDVVGGGGGERARPLDNVELSRNRRSLNSEIVIAPSLSLSGSIPSHPSLKSSLHLHNRSYLTLSNRVSFISYVFLCILERQAHPGTHSQVRTPSGTIFAMISSQE